MASGFEKWFEFGAHEHSTAGKLKNVVFAWAMDLFWTIVATLLLVTLIKLSLLNLSHADLKGLIQAQLGLYGSVAAILGPSPWILFFLACIMAPLWEEIVFRYFPLRLAQAIEKAVAPEQPKINLVLPAVMFTSVIFGLVHGSVFNILFQGVSGILLAWVFLKNNSYWSAVILHSLWNTMLLFGFPTLFNMMNF